MNKYLSIILIYSLMSSAFANIPLRISEEIFFSKDFKFTSNVIDHTITRGDTLMILSRIYYGTLHNWTEIIEANPEIDPNMIKLGQIIKIPVKEKMLNYKAVDTSKNFGLLIKEKFLPRSINNNSDEEIHVTSNSEIIEQEANIQQSGLEKQTEVPVDVEQATEKKKINPKWKYEVVSKPTINVVYENQINQKYLDIISDKEKEAFNIKSKLEENLKMTLSQKEEFESKYNETMKELTNLKTEHSELLSQYSDTTSELDKIKQEKELLVDRKIASLDTNGEYDKMKRDFASLQDEYLNLKKSSISSQQNERELQNVASKFKLAEEKVKELRVDNSELSRKVASLEKQVKNDEKSHPLYLKSLLANSQEHVIKEKNRILTERIWVEKNKEYGKCIVNLVPNNDNTEKVVFRDLILYLNDSYGSENVFIAGTDNIVIFKIPGKAVYGTQKPVVNQQFKEQFYKINEYLEGLPVQSVEVIGKSRFDKVKGASGGYVDGLTFALRQSVTIQNHFITELGMKPKIITSKSWGYKPDDEDSAKKEFIFKVKFKSNEVNNRAIASVISKDKVLETIQEDLLAKLGEPKYSKLNIDSNGVEVHLGRHYFFNSNETALTDKGMDYLKTVFEMFSLSSDVNFEVEWVPAKNEEYSEILESRNYREIASVKGYLMDKFTWLKNKVLFGHANRHHNIAPPHSYENEKFNKRIVFRIVPKDINVKQLDELGDSK